MKNKLNIKLTLTTTALSTILLLGCKPISLNVLQERYEDMLYGEEELEFTDELHEAALKGYLDKIEFFIEEDLKIDMKDNEGRTALHYACMSDSKDDNLPVVQILISKIPIDEQDNQGTTALHIAYHNKSYKIVKFLLEQQANPNIKDQHGRTILHYSSMDGNAVITDLCLQHNANTQITDNQKHTPLFYATENNHKQVLNLLKQHKAKLQQTRGNELNEAALKGNIDKIEFLIKGDLKIDMKDSEGKTALHYACMSNSKDHNLLLVQILIGRIPIDELDSNGNTALHIAYRNKCYKIVKFLLEQKANPNIKYQYGRTILHHASIKGNAEVTAMLLQHNADTQITDNDNHTPLFYANKHNHRQVLNLLQQHKATLSDNEQKVQEQRQEEKMEQILKMSRLSSNNPDEALLWTVEKNELEIAKWLIINKKANINAKNKYGWTPLHLSARYGHTQAADLLIKAGANVNAKTNDGCTPLHKAAHSNHTQVAELLIKAGANVNERNNYGCTPLHWANENKAVEELLIKAGANADSKRGECCFRFTFSNLEVVTK